MTQLTAYFIKHPRITYMIVFLVFLSGILSMISLQREELPYVEMNMIKITTEYPGASPGDVEVNVTSKIESKIINVEGLKKVTSISMEDLSIIVVEIDPEADDPDAIKTDIRDAVVRVTDLPVAVSGKPYIEEITSSYPIIEIAIHGTVSELELRRYTRDLESRIKEIQGVGGVEKIGYRKREIHIDADISKMKEELISFHDIITAIKSRNVRAGSGSIKTNTSEKSLVTDAGFRGPMDVKNAILRSNYEGFSLRLTDVAVISDDFAEPRVLYRANGKPGMALMVTKQKKADIIALSDDLRKVITDFRKTLPKTVKVDEIYDFSILTRTMLDIVVNNAIIGFVLVLMVMFLFLDVRSAFWSAFGIPFSIVGGVILFLPFGLDLNMVSLGAMILIIGIIVDDAIVISEKIYSNKQAGMAPQDAAISGVRRLIVPVSASVMTTVLAFMPVLFIPGIMGRFMKQLPIVITITLTFSLLESFLFLPAHVSHGTISQEEPRRIRWLKPVKEWYRNTLYRALKNRNRVMAGYIIFLISAFILSGFFLKFMLEEDIDPDYFTVVIEAPQGSSLSQTAKMLPVVERTLNAVVPDKILKSYTTHIGHHNKSTDYITTGGRFSNYALITVYLIPAAERDITSESIMKALRPKLETLKKMNGFQRLEIEYFGFSAAKAVEVIYMSDNDGDRNRFEADTIALLKKINGVSGVETSNITGKDEVKIKFDYRSLARAGITAMDVAKTIRTAFDGTVVTSIQKDGEEIDYRVRIKNKTKSTVNSILTIPVSNREGHLVPLKYFAHLKEMTGPAALHHFNGKRSVTISANVDDRIITSPEVNRMIRDKFMKKAATVPGLRMKIAGQEEEMSISMRGFYFALIIGVIAIYFLLVIIFDSYLQPLLIMSILPFAAAGAFLTLMMHNRPLVFISLVGLLGLIGVAVNDTIVMISQLNREQQDKGKSFEAIADGAMDRFRPIILTTLTTFAGLLPTAYGIGGDMPMIRPLVLVMAWGLVFVTMVTLGFIPILYSYVAVRDRNAK